MSGPRHSIGVTFQSAGKRWRALVLAGLAAAACSAIPKDNPATGTLQPVDIPAYEVGTVFHQHDLLTGQDSFWRIVDVQDGLVHAESRSGCRYSFRDPLLPTLTWDDCSGAAGWTSGRRTFTAAEGSLWPLRVGNKARYEVSWTGNGGQTDSGTLDCSVDQAVRLTVRAGEMDAYRVVCLLRWSDVSRTRITYWAPELGQVRFTDTHSRQGTTTSTELIRVEAPV